MKHNQRGVIATFYLYAAAILAVTLALGGLYYVIDKRGYDRGTAEVKRDWLAANEEAEKAEAAARIRRQAEADKAAKDLASAGNKARDFESRWRAAKAANPVLATVICPKAGTGNVAGIPSAANSGGDGISLRLSADFLRLYDTAWTDQAGKPIFADTGIPADPSTPAVTLDALLDAHAENASRCSQNSRQLNALIDLLTALRK